MKFTTIVRDDVCRHMSKEKPGKWFVFITLEPCAYDFCEGVRLCRKMGIEMMSKDPNEVWFKTCNDNLHPFAPIWYWTTFDSDEESYEYVRTEWWNEKSYAFAARWYDGEFYGDNT